MSEDPIGLVKVPKTDSETLYSTLQDILVRCMLPLEKRRGQAYDGASNMSGHIRGVAARVKREKRLHCTYTPLPIHLTYASKMLPVCVHLLENAST